MFKTNRNLYNAKKEELMSINLISEKLIREILNPENKRKAKLHFQFMQKNQIDIISIADNCSIII